MDPLKRYSAVAAPEGGDLNPWWGLLRQIDEAFTDAVGKNDIRMRATVAGNEATLDFFAPAYETDPETGENAAAWKSTPSFSIGASVEGEGSDTRFRIANKLVTGRAYDVRLQKTGQRRSEWTQALYTSYSLHPGYAGRDERTDPRFTYTYAHEIAGSLLAQGLRGIDLQEAATTKYPDIFAREARDILGSQFASFASYEPSVPLGLRYAGFGSRTVPTNPQFADVHAQSIEAGIDYLNRRIAGYPGIQNPPKSVREAVDQFFQHTQLQPASPAKGKDWAGEVLAASRAPTHADALKPIRYSAGAPMAAVMGRTGTGAFYTQDAQGRVVPMVYSTIAPEKQAKRGGEMLANVPFYREDLPRQFGTFSTGMAPIHGQPFRVSFAMGLPEGPGQAMASVMDFLGKRMVSEPMDSTIEIGDPREYSFNLGSYAPKSMDTPFLRLGSRLFWNNTKLTRNITGATVVVPATASEEEIEQLKSSWSGKAAEGSLDFASLEWKRGGVARPSLRMQVVKSGEDAVRESLGYKGESSIKALLAPTIISYGDDRLKNAYQIPTQYARLGEKGLPQIVAADSKSIQSTLVHALASPEYALASLPVLRKHLTPEQFAEIEGSTARAKRGYTGVSDTTMEALIRAANEFFFEHEFTEAEPWGMRDAMRSRPIAEGEVSVWQQGIERGEFPGLSIERGEKNAPHLLWRGKELFFTSLLNLRDVHGGTVRASTRAEMMNLAAMNPELMHKARKDELVWAQASAHLGLVSPGSAVPVSKLLSLGIDPEAEDHELAALIAQSEYGTSYIDLGGVLAEPMRIIAKEYQEDKGDLSPYAKAVVKNVRRAMFSAAPFSGAPADLALARREELATDKILERLTTRTPSPRLGGTYYMGGAEMAVYAGDDYLRNLFRPANEDDFSEIKRLLMEGKNPVRFARAPISELAQPLVTLLRPMEALYPGDDPENAAMRHAYSNKVIAHSFLAALQAGDYDRDPMALVAASFYSAKEGKIKPWGRNLMADERSLGRFLRGTDLYDVFEGGFDLAKLADAVHRGQYNEMSKWIADVKKSQLPDWQTKMLQPLFRFTPQELHQSFADRAAAKGVMGFAFNPIENLRQKYWEEALARGDPDPRWYAANKVMPYLKWYQDALDANPYRPARLNAVVNKMQELYGAGMDLDPGAAVDLRNPMGKVLGIGVKSDIDPMDPQAAIASAYYETESFGEKPLRAHLAHAIYDLMSPNLPEFEKSARSGPDEVLQLLPFKGAEADELRPILEGAYAGERNLTALEDFFGKHGGVWNTPEGIGSGLMALVQNPIARTLSGKPASATGDRSNSIEEMLNVLVAGVQTPLLADTLRGAGVEEEKVAAMLQSSALTKGVYAAYSTLGGASRSRQILGGDALAGPWMNEILNVLGDYGVKPTPEMLKPREFMGNLARRTLAMDQKNLPPALALALDTVRAMGIEQGIGGSGSAHDVAQRFGAYAWGSQYGGVGEYVRGISKRGYLKRTVGEVEGDLWKTILPERLTPQNLQWDDWSPEGLTKLAYGAGASLPGAIQAVSIAGIPGGLNRKQAANAFMYQSVATMQEYIASGGDALLDKVWPHAEQWARGSRKFKADYKVDPNWNAEQLRQHKLRWAGLYAREQFQDASWRSRYEMVDFAGPDVKGLPVYEQAIRDKKGRLAALVGQRWIDRYPDRDINQPRAIRSQADLDKFLDDLQGGRIKATWGGLTELYKQLREGHAAAFAMRVGEIVPGGMEKLYALSGHRRPVVEQVARLLMDKDEPAENLLAQEPAGTAAFESEAEDPYRISPSDLAVELAQFARDELRNIPTAQEEYASFEKSLVRPALSTLAEKREEYLPGGESSEGIGAGTATGLGAAPRVLQPDEIDEGVAEAVLARTGSSIDGTPPGPPPEPPEAVAAAEPDDRSPSRNRTARERTRPAEPVETRGSPMSPEASELIGDRLGAAVEAARNMALGSVAHLATKADVSPEEVAGSFYKQFGLAKGVAARILTENINPLIADKTHPLADELASIPALLDKMMFNEQRATADLLYTSAGGELDEGFHYRPSRGAQQFSGTSDEMQEVLLARRELQRERGEEPDLSDADIQYLSQHGGIGAKGVVSVHIKGADREYYEPMARILAGGAPGAAPGAAGAGISGGAGVAAGGGAPAGGAAAGSGGGQLGVPNVEAAMGGGPSGPPNEGGRGRMEPGMLDSLGWLMFNARRISWLTTEQVMGPMRDYASLEAQAGSVEGMLSGQIDRTGPAYRMRAAQVAFDSARLAFGKSAYDVWGGYYTPGYGEGLERFAGGEWGQLAATALPMAGASIISGMIGRTILQRTPGGVQVGQALAGAQPGSFMNTLQLAAGSAITPIIAGGIGGNMGAAWLGGALEPALGPRWSGLGADVLGAGATVGTGAWVASKFLASGAPTLMGLGPWALGAGAAIGGYQLVRGAYQAVGGPEKDQRAVDKRLAAILQKPEEEQQGAAWAYDKDMDSGFAPLDMWRKYLTWRQVRAYQRGEYEGDPDRITGSKMYEDIYDKGGFSKWVGRTQGVALLGAMAESGMGISATVGQPLADLMTQYGWTAPQTAQAATQMLGQIGAMPWEPYEGTAIAQWADKSVNAQYKFAFDLVGSSVGGSLQKLGFAPQAAQDIIDRLAGASVAGRQSQQAFRGAMQALDISSQFAWSALVPELATVETETGLPLGTTERRRMEDEIRMRNIAWDVQTALFQTKQDIPRVRRETEKALLQSDISLAGQALDISGQKLGISQLEFQMKYAGAGIGFSERKLGLSVEQAVAGYQWGREDLAMDWTQFGLQSAWGAEDYRLARRKARGEDRRALDRQYQRSLVQQGLQATQLERKGERMDAQYGWQTEGLGIQGEELELEKRKLSEQLPLMERQLGLAKDRLGLTQEQYDLSVKYHGAEKEYIQAKGDFEVASIQHSVEMNGLQASYGEEILKDQSALEDHIAQWQTILGNAPELLKQYGEWGKLLEDIRDNKVKPIVEDLEKILNPTLGWSDAGAGAPLGQLKAIGTGPVFIINVNGSWEVAQAVQSALEGVANTYQ